jgi:molecular chaperone DnaK
VTFDIDANGIVHVHAKDKGTGKEQSIRITASSGLSEDEINRMVKDAEEHADEDHRRREAAEARNNLDRLIHDTEKNLKEHGDDLAADDKSSIESALEDAKKNLETDDPEVLKAAFEKLTQVQHKLAEKMYAKTAQGGGGDEQASGGPSGETGGKSDDDVVDADFEEVKE